MVVRELLILPMAITTKITKYLGDTDPEKVFRHLPFLNKCCGGGGGIVVVPIVVPVADEKPPEEDK